MDECSPSELEKNFTHSTVEIRMFKARIIQSETLFYSQSINQSIEIFSVAQIESITETTKA